MNIDWNHVLKSVTANILTGLLVGAVGAYILFSVTMGRHDDRLDKLEQRPFLTFTGHITGTDQAKATITVPEGHEASILISANGSAASASSQFRANINLTIEVNGNALARESVWIPQYLYDPLKFEDASMTPEQVQLQQRFPLVATPIKRLERMGPINLSVSASTIVTLGPGTHTIRAACSGDDSTAHHTNLNYIDIRNANAGSSKSRP